MLRTIVSLGFVQAIGLLITTIRAKVFALLLGPAGFGVVATIDQLVVSTSQFSNLSVPFTALKFLSRGHSLGEEQFRNTYAAFLRAITLLAVLATVAAVLFIPGNLADLDPQVARYRAPVLIALLGIPAFMMQVFFANVLAARGKSLESILLTTAFSFVVMVSGWIGCLLGGIRGIYLATVPASTLLILGMAIFARKRMGLPFHSRGARLWDGLRGNADVVQTAVLTYVAVCSHAALLLVARYESLTRLGEEAAGLLQAGLGIGLSIGAVLAPANTLHFTPYVNRALPASEKADAAAIFLPRLVLLYCLAALPVLVAPELVVRVLFSDRFTAAAPILGWFVVWQCLYQITNVYLQLLIGLDDVVGGCTITALGNALAVALCTSLSGTFGLAGIGMAFVAGALAIGSLCALRLRSRFALMVPSKVLALAAYGAFGLAAVGAVGALTPVATIQGMAMRFLVAVAFLTGLWLAVPSVLRAELWQDVSVRVRALAGRASPPVSR